MVCADAADYGKGQRTKIYGGARQTERPATPRIKRDARPAHRGRRGASGYRFNTWSCGSVKKARCAHRLVDSGSGPSCDKRPWDCCSTITPKRGPALHRFRAFQGGAKTGPGYWATSRKDRPLKRTREHPEFATSSARRSRRRKYGLLRKANKRDFPSMRSLSNSVFPKQRTYVHVVIEPADGWLPLGPTHIRAECPTKSRLLKDGDKHLRWCVRVK